MPAPRSSTTSPGRTVARIAACQVSRRAASSRRNDWKRRTWAASDALSTSPSAPVVARLLLDRALGPGHALQAVVRDRLAALDREAELPLRQTLLRALDGLLHLAQPGGQTLLPLGLVQVRPGVGQMLIDVRELLVLGRPQVGERALDPLALARQQLACACLVHGYCLPATAAT